MLKQILLHVFLLNPAVAGAGAKPSILNSINLFRVVFIWGEWVGGYLGKEASRIYFKSHPNSNPSKISSPECHWNRFNNLSQVPLTTPSLFNKLRLKQDPSAQ
jgi:hypothetical protein